MLNKRKNIKKRILAYITVCVLTIMSLSIYAADSTSDSQKPVISSKKGVCSWYYASSKAEQRDMSILRKTGATWTYNWGNTIEAAEEAKVSNIEYVPMVWGAGSVTSTELSKLKSGAESGLYKNLLAFNEPDLRDQANMTVEQAISLWPKLMETGLRLGSPAGAAAEDAWVEQFMAKAKELNYRVDFLTIHVYQDFTHPGSVQSFKEALERLHNKYSIPIWITELGAINVEPLWYGYKNYGPLTHEASTKYIKEVTDMLESLDYVERYAWFVDSSSDIRGTEFTRLFDTATGELTQEGLAYKIAGPKEKPEVTTQFESNVETTKVKAPSRAKIKKVRNYKKRGIKISLKKVKNADGYKVQISRNKKFKKKITINTKKLKVVKKKLKAKKKYFVRVKAYKIVNQTKVYSEKWSIVKKIKIK